MRAQCAFWDETAELWSTKGLNERDIGTAELICATDHLTVFGAVIGAFEHPGDIRIASLPNKG